MYPFVLGLSRIMAYAGGLVLTALIVMTCLSIFGRSMNGVLHSDSVQAVMPVLADWLIALGVGPINGDFELVEAGMAFTIFAFLPLCQITNGHASVDVFTSRFSKQTNRVLIWLGEVAFALVLILFAVQLYDGMLSKLRSGQTTYLIQFPIWWAYALSVAGAATAAFVAVYVAAIRTREMLSGRDILPAGGGADH